MNSSDSPNIEISVIVPVFQTDPKLIKETLQSVVDQTLDKESYEIIVVDDGSTSNETFDFLVQLAQSDNLNGIPLTVLRHQSNKWLAEVRNTGAEHARGEFLCFLDSDDLIDPDYLKKGLLSLRCHPNAGWTYPVVRNFGFRHDLIQPPDFNTWKFFFKNPVVNASVIRKSCWERMNGQRTLTLINDVKFYEDWDFWVRAMQRGYYAIPLRDSTFHYRRRIKSMITRSPLLHFLSAYSVWHKNLWKFPLQFFSQRSYRRDLYPEFRFRKLPQRILGKVVSSPLPYKLKLFPVSLFLDSIFRKNTFIKKCLSGKYLPSTAEWLCGFSEKPKTTDLEVYEGRAKNTVFFAHCWWRRGGAEQILLDWLISARTIEGLRVVDIARESTPDDNPFERIYSQHCDDQFTINKIGVTAGPQLAFSWELIKHEVPKVIMIMSNSFYYSLLPKIKRRFPDTKVIDLLHNEEGSIWSWYAVADEYKEYMDLRVVTSDYWRDVLIEKYGEIPEKIVVAENGISLDQFDSSTIDKNEARRLLGVPKDVFVVGFIGRLEPQKNPEVMLELARYCRNDTRLFFVIVGSGPLEQKISPQLRQLPNIKHFPYTNTPQNFYRAFDMLACPSRYEGYPLTGIEAAAMKVPLIATDIPGLREQVTRSQFGYLYEPVDLETDARKMYQIIENYISDPSLDPESGRAFVESFHDIKKQRELYKEILQKLL